jgi:hypothetical protein
VINPNDRMIVMLAHRISPFLAISSGLSGRNEIECRLETARSMSVLGHN